MTKTVSPGDFPARPDKVPAMADQPAADYTFGDSSTAGDRLALLAAVFEQSSDALLRRAAPVQPTVAIDLGCGPGYTTALVARCTGATRTVGLDASETFVTQARRSHIRLEFVQHDVTRAPLPTPPADVLHSRFLLAHLPDPIAVLAAWASHLTIGGRLVTDETERIDTDVETFALYEATAKAMVAHHGANLQIGAVTRDLAAPRDTTLVHSGLCEVRPSTATVARLYGMNLATWRHDPFVVEHIPRTQIDHLSRGLAVLEESDQSDELTFCNRQVIYERG
jgi:trans-aconitate 2-methyltransferase